MYLKIGNNNVIEWYKDLPLTQDLLQGVKMGDFTLLYIGDRGSTLHKLNLIYVKSLNKYTGEWVMIPRATTAYEDRSHLNKKFAVRKL
jgi:hypothetical protein